MDGQIDPRLGASTTTPTPTAANNPPPSQQPPLRYEHPPPQFPSHQSHQQGPIAPNQPNANLGAYPSHTPPQPYYNYPTPQGHTPQQQPTPNQPSTASHSTQPSPAGTYQPPIHHHQQEQDDGGSHSPDDDQDGPTQPGEDPKRPRACEACRGLKVRCDQDPNRPELPCKRCAKANRQCIITAPSRKRQKKADGRVAELEKKLDALTSILQQQQQHQQHQQQAGQHYGSPYGAPPAPPMNSYPHTAQQTHQYGQSPMQPPHKRKRTDDEELRESLARANAEEQPTIKAGHQPGPFKQPDTRDGGPQYLSYITSEELIARINSLVPTETGVAIFNRYVEKLSPHMPAVVFARGTTAEQIRAEKPILYVCILSAGSSNILSQEVSRQLTREAVRALADHVLCNGAKSLELIQAMQVLVLWYKPPERAEQTNFYQIIHMAAVMAIDVGLGKRFNPAKARRGFGGPNAECAPGPHLQLPTDSDTIEARRAWLACYYLCASASMVLRRPNLVHWTKYMSECVDVLETSPEAAPTDKFFCQHVKIQHICEEVSVQFLMDDTTATISITDPKVTYALAVLENELKSWREKIPSELQSHPELKFYEHVASLYLHEIALHFNHNVEDFKLPFTEESLKSVNPSSEKLTQNQMSALDACRSSAHGILDTMLSFDKDTVSTLPMLLYFVRCTYAVVVLIKMHVAVTTPGSEISKLMSIEQINCDHYLDRLMELFNTMANGSEYRPPSKILHILSMLKSWFQKHKEGLPAAVRGEQTAQQQELQSGNNNNNSETLLHQLAQTASVIQSRQQQGQPQASAQNWSFDSSYPGDYNTRQHSGSTDAQFQQQQQTGFNGGNSTADQVDPSNPWLWGFNFQQAMDLNLASMDGISGGNMDGFFMGDGLAPFSFNGDF